MSRKIDEYINSINSITPSESFISDTEAMMRKYRDEHMKNGISVNSDNKGITITRSGRRRYTAAALSVAAAAILCVTALRIVDNTASEESMAVQLPETTAETTLQEETAVSETEESLAEAAVTEADIADSENGEAFADRAAETEAPAPAEEYILIEEKWEEEDTTGAGESVYVYHYDTPDIGTNAMETTAAEAKIQESEPPAFSGTAAVTEVTAEPTIMEDAVPVEAAVTSPTEAVTVTSALTEAVISPAVFDYAQEEQYDDDADCEDSMSNTAAYGSYEEAVVSTAAMNQGNMVYIPGFDPGYDSEDDEAVFEEDAGIPMSAHIFAANEYSAFSYSDYYVPDTIDQLDEGTYNIRYIDKDSAAIDILSDDQSVLNEIIRTVSDVCRGKNVEMSEGEAFLDSDSVRLYISSSVLNGDVMFLIIFNNDSLIINRYENGTVSSENYSITSDEYERINSVVYKNV